MRTKFTALILASLVGAGAMFMAPTQASAFSVPSAQRDIVNQALGTGTEGLYQEARHRRWHNRHHRRHGWRHRRNWDGDYGYYPRRRHWRRHRNWDYYDYDYGYRRPGLYFGFGL